MEALLAYAGYGKSDNSARTEALGADLSKRGKRLRPGGGGGGGAGSPEAAPPVPISAYSTSTSASTHAQLRFQPTSAVLVASSSSDSSSVASGGGGGGGASTSSDGGGAGSSGSDSFSGSGSGSGGSASPRGGGGAAAPPYGGRAGALLQHHQQHQLQQQHHHKGVHPLLLGMDGGGAGGAGGGGGAAGGDGPGSGGSTLRFNIAGSSGGLGSLGGGGGGGPPLPKYGGLRKGANSTLFDMVAMCKRLWLLAWPLSWMEVLTFTKELIITSYVGHLGAAELSALVLAQTVYNVTGNAPMLGFVTAMETFCGQAFGARRYGLVGVVLQRGLAISGLYCCAALGMWRWCEAALVAMGQDPTISASAARFTLALAPALFMDAADQCCRRYLSAQAVVQPLMLVTLIATLLTPLFLWLFVAKLGLGLLGAAVAWDAVQATSLGLMVCCCVLHTRAQEPGRCTWPGWTSEALRDWGTYVRMAIPSCVMICLDWWTFEVIVMLSGLLPNPEQTMSMMGITFNIHALCFFAAHGLSGAASTRVGNDLGGGRPHMAWLTVQVAVLMGTLVMIASSGLLLLGRHQLGKLFSGEADVVMLTAQAVPPLAVSLVGEGANTVLAGVMRGCGRQKIGASINLVTYWVFGLPIACLLAFPGGLGALGLWTGLACTASLQALLMTLTVFKFNWVEEAARAKALVAAGELLLEDEDPYDGHGGGAKEAEKFGLLQAHEADDPGGDGHDKGADLAGAVGRRSTARQDLASRGHGGDKGGLIKAGSPELGRLLP
ncbi:DTX16 [Scenedesmus sp. PABB004]|nr:DTX16 [Scenedesmus sp. PABB004]